MGGVQEQPAAGGAGHAHGRDGARPGGSAVGALQAGGGGVHGHGQAPRAGWSLMRASQCSASPVMAATVRSGVQDDDARGGGRNPARVTVWHGEALAASDAEVGREAAGQAHLGGVNP